jgi:hypothetical protein
MKVIWGGRWLLLDLWSPARNIDLGRRLTLLNKSLQRKSGEVKEDEWKLE